MTNLRICRRFWFGAAAIFLVVFAVYWPALRGEFIWDDALLIQKNPLMKGALGLRSIWFQTDFPLTMIAFWLEWLAWGKNPVGYHVVNVLLHGTGAVLLWRVLLRLEIQGAWLAAAIFAVHPVCAASVAWISELKNTLSLPFFLLSIYFYLKLEEEWRVKGRGGTGETSSLQDPDSKRQRRFYLLSLGAFVLGLLSKTTTVMLPIVLLLCMWWWRTSPTHRLTGSPAHARSRPLTPIDFFRLIPFFVLSLVFGFLSIWFQAHQAMPGGVVQTENFWGRLAGAGKTVWFYLGKALAPVHLNMIYPRWKIEASAPLSYLPLVGLLVVVVLCWRFRHSWGRPLLFGFGYFVVTLFPALGFFDFYYLAISRVSDHLQYLSLIGVVALLAAGLTMAWEWGRSRLSRVPPHPNPLPWGEGAAAAVLLLMLSVLSFQRAQVLAKDETLWRDTLAKNPDAWTAHNNLGCILAEQNKIGQAISHFVASLQVNPNNAQAYCNLGKALSLQNQIEPAEAHLRTAVQLKPNDADIQRSFASVLIERGKTEEALAHLREAVRLDPDVETRLQFARLLHATGRMGETVAQYRAILAAKPDSLEALNNLAWILATCADDKVRNGAEAVRAAERACRLTKYKEVMPLGTLAAAYAEAGRFGDAVKTGERSLQLATATRDERSAAINRQLLSLYRAGKPYHEGKPTTNAK